MLPPSLPSSADSDSVHPASTTAASALRVLTYPAKEAQGQEGELAGLHNSTLAFLL